MLGGVAGGIAQTYGWDATLVRLAFVIAALLGIGIPAYVVAWIVIPAEDGDGEPERREGPAIIALLLLGVGVLLLGGRLLPRGHRIVDVMWAVALIGGGLFVLVMRSNSKQDTSESNVAFGPPAPTYAFVPPDAPSDASTEPGDTDAAPAASDAADAAAPDASVAPSATTESAWTQRAPWPYWPEDPPRHPRHPRPPRHRSFLTPLTISILLLGAGVAALLEVTGAMDVDPAAVGALGLGVIGLALIVSAWAGRGARVGADRRRAVARAHAADDRRRPVHRRSRRPQLSPDGAERYRRRAAPRPGPAHARPPRRTVPRRHDRDGSDGRDGRARRAGAQRRARRRTRRSGHGPGRGVRRRGRRRLARGGRHGTGDAAAARSNSTCESAWARST